MQIIEQLWALKWSMDEFLVDCAAYYANIAAWCAQYNVAGARVTGGAFFSESHSANLPDGPSTLANARVIGVRDIEENVWCNKYGIRGKVDITVNAHTADGRMTVVPVELKTVSHYMKMEKSP